MSKSYVVFDLETTGLDYREEQIIEIGAVKFDEALSEIGTFHKMVALEADRELPEFITNLTGITSDDLTDGVDEQEALFELKEFIGDSIVVAQNAPFDLSFVSRGGIYPEVFLCTRAVSKYLEMEKSASLKDVTNRKGISLEGHHRALNDVYATAEILETQLSELSSYEFDPHNVIMSEPKRPLRFTPRHAKIRTVYDLTLSSQEIAMIAQYLPQNSELQKRVADVCNRPKGDD